jgi:hypothetical protein
MEATFDEAVVDKLSFPQYEYLGESIGTVFQYTLSRDRYSWPTMQPRISSAAASAKLDRAERTQCWVGINHEHPLASNMPSTRMS